ncbi:arsenite transporter [Desulfocarbo indianensis]|nr:arsenite transporter [Desulfocarbo indianensis]
MFALLAKISRNLVTAIPVMMLAGFLYGWLGQAGWLRELIIPFTFLMVYPMMVTLKIKKVLEGGDLKAQVLTQLINFGLIPFVAFALGRAFFPDQPYLALGLLLAGLVPTSGMTISWTGFAGGNLAAAVKMTVVGLTLGSLATPFYVKYLMGAELEVNLAAVMRQIGLIVFLPMVAGFATQRLLVRRFGEQGFQKTWAPRFPGLSTLGVLGIVFIAMALKAPSLAGDPQLLVYLLAPLALLYALNYALGTAVAKLALPRGDGIALVYGTVMRNLSIALAVAMGAFGAAGSEAALVICVAYILQVQSAAWYVRFSDRVFGPASAEAPAAAH